MKYFLSILAVLSNFVFTEEVWVSEKRIFDNASFTGFYNESSENPIWGLLEYDIGEIFSGKFKNGDYEMGKYEFPDGASGFFQAEKGLKNSLNYKFFGQYVSTEEEKCHGYFESIFIFNGYFFCEIENGGTVETFYKENIAEGYYRHYFENGDIWYGYWKDGSLDGDAYYYFAESKEYSKYRWKNKNSSQPKIMNDNDYNRLQKIRDLIDKNFSDFEQKWNKLLVDWDAYYAFVENFTNSGNTAYNNLDSEKSDLIFSIQELLLELGFSPGKPDGVMGKKTSSAIKAFQLINDLEADGKPSDNLLIFLQVALRSEKSRFTKKDNLRLSGTGSGFYVNKKNIITNFHVIENCIELKNFKEEPLEKIAVDEINDLAVLEGPKVNSSFNISPDAPVLGEEVYVSGYPLFDVLKGINFTSGNVSALKGLGQDISQFQFTAPLQPGNSGGPILNDRGSVIGVAVAGLKTKQLLEKTEVVAQNANFGIKNTLLLNLLIDNNLSHKTSNSYWPKSQRDLASLATKNSVLIKCYEN